MLCKVIDGWKPEDLINEMLLPREGHAVHMQLPESLQRGGGNITQELQADLQLNVSTHSLFSQSKCSRSEL